MRVLFAPHHFGSLLTPDIAAEALAQGWREARPEDDLVLHPHSDGSTGFLKVVSGTTEILMLSHDGNGVPVPVVRSGRDENEWHTVYCQMGGVDEAAALTAEGFMTASSAPAGELLGELLQRGARRIVVSAGFAPWHDGGAGLLRTLARRLGFSAPAGTGGGAVIDPESAALIPPVREALRGVEIIVASSREVPLRGLHGAGAELADLPLITAQEAQAIEALSTAFVTAVDQAVKEQELLGLLGVPEVLASRRPFVGAGGGAAFMLLALGAKVFPGAWVIGEETALNQSLGGCDLVVTGAEVIAGEELSDGVVADVATRAATDALPVIAVGGRIDASRGQLFKAGINSGYPVTDTPSGRPQLVAPPATHEALVARGGRLARTWSR